MIKVMHLITELASGGAQSLLLRQLAELDRQRFPATVASFYNSKGLVAQRIQQLGIPVFDLQMENKLRVDAFARFYHLLRTVKPTILHTWLFHANLPGRLLGRLAGVPIIITSRHNITIGGPQRERLLRWTNRLDDRVIAVCEAARQAEISAAGADPGKVVTIYNGVDSQKFTLASAANRTRIRHTLGIDPAALVIGTVGRMHPQKGLPVLLEAFAKVHGSIANVHLLHIGDGELRPAIEAQVQAAGWQQQVHLLGERADVLELLWAFDLFVLPSLWEGLPVAVLEAMASGLPVVATAVGGIPEVVVDGSTGLLVPPGDADALATALIHLLRSPTLRAQMGTAGRQSVEQNFSQQRMLQQTTRLYEELVALKCRDLGIRN